MITLKEVIRDDLQHQTVLYELLRQRSTEADQFVNISHRALPSWDEHVAFVSKHPYRAWYLLFAGEQFAGSLSCTYQNEIGIVLMPAHRGKGYGRQAVKNLLELHEPLPAVPSERVGRWLANINPKNKASIAMFNDLGFRPKQVTYEL